MFRHWRSEQKGPVDLGAVIGLGAVDPLIADFIHSRLERLARKYLAVLATSATAEHNFPQLGLIFRDH